MEDLLRNLAKEAVSFKNAELEKAATNAYMLLECQQGNTREAPYLLREKCFAPFKMALDTKRTKLVSIATNGICKMVKDDRFHSNSEPADDSVWFSSQLLHAFSSMQTQCDDSQVEMLKTLLYAACSPNWMANGRVIIQILNQCSEIYENGTVSTKSAAQSASSQTIRALCQLLEEEFGNSEDSECCVEMSRYNEIIPILQFICSKVDEIQKSDRSARNTSFFLECLRTLISSLPVKISVNRHFTTFIWQKLCPVLIAYLGSPIVDKRIVAREGDVCSGRGSAVLGGELAFDAHQCKTIYSIGNELVRLVGSVASMRPVLESVYYRMLLYPKPQQRLEALRALKEVLRSPNRLMDLCGPLMISLEDEDETTARSCQKGDMALLRLAMDCVEECGVCGDWDMAGESVCCLSSLLNGLIETTAGKDISEMRALRLNKTFPKLEDSDYKGPLTYASISNIPREYDDSIKRKAEEESSLSSGDTEGPENEDNSQEETGAKYEAAILNRLNEARECARRHLFSMRISRNEDKENVRNFVENWQAFLPNLFHCPSILHVDEKLREFSSKYCRAFLAADGNSSVVANADGIYLSTYAALCLNLDLIRSNHYENSRKPPSTTTEAEFVDGLYDNDAVYLSPSWLSELYQRVLTTDFLSAAGYKQRAEKKDYYSCPFVNVLTDLKGGDGENGKLLTDYIRVKRACSKPENTPEIEAGRKFARRVLTCAWDSAISVLRAVTRKSFKREWNLRGGGSLLRWKSGKVHDSSPKAVFERSLQCLQKMAQLAASLGLQNRCGVVISLLADSACPLGNTLTASQALSMDMILNRGLELGSYSPDCWKHIFKCASYVWHLERVRGNKSTTVEDAFLKIRLKSSKTDKAEAAVSDNLEFSFNNMESAGKTPEDEIMDVYSFLSTSPSPVASGMTTREKSVQEIMEEIRRERRNSLNEDRITEIIRALSRKIDSLFEEASVKLNMEALCSFGEDLCRVSREEIFSKNDDVTDSKAGRLSSVSRWWRGKGGDDDKIEAKAAFLIRLNHLVMKTARSARPLVHSMKLWTIVSSHYAEAACSQYDSVCEAAMDCIRDGIRALLNEHSELAHFHFNKDLFKPFEILAVLGDVCSPNMKDGVIARICEFVENNPAEVKSGWQSLLGGLSAAIGGSVSNALLVERAFEVFTQIEGASASVFTEASAHFVECLMKFLEDGDDDAEGEKGGNLPQIALKYFQKCCSSFRRLHNSGQRCYFPPISPISVARVDAIIPDKQLILFGGEDFSEDEDASYAILACPPDRDEEVERLNNDSDSHALKTWYWALERFTRVAVSGAVAGRARQTATLEACLEMAGDLARDKTTPSGFGLSYLNNALLPRVQIRLREIGLESSGNNNNNNNNNNNYYYRSNGGRIGNFKQAYGILSDIIAAYFARLKEANELDKGTILLKQFVLLTGELIANSAEILAKLGCSCYRHVVSKAGWIFNADQWEIACMGLRRACVLSLSPLSQLMAAFYPSSKSFYGDFAQVKVATRRDSTLRENLRIKQLSQQMFLLDNQRDDFNRCADEEEEKRYILLLCSPKDDSIVVRIPYRDILIGLLANQLLLQTIATILVQGTPRVVASLANVLLQSAAPFRENSRLGGFGEEGFGMTPVMRKKEIGILLRTLEWCYGKAVAFDARPGLKFLMQKVAGLERAANLYKEAGACCTLKMLALLELYFKESRKCGLTLEQAKDTMERLDLNYDEEADGDSDGGDAGGMMEGKRKDSVHFYLLALRESFDQLCAKYVEVVLDENGVYSIVDSVENRPIFFLISENADHLPSGQEENSESVYAMATSKHIDDVIGEYSKRKKSFAAAASGTTTRKNPFLEEENDKCGESDHQPLPPEVEQQRKNSIYKDSEARLAVWAEVLVSVFDILSQIPDEEFRVLLPALFNGVRALTAHATHKNLKHAVAEFFHRVATVYGFTS